MYVPIIACIVACIVRMYVSRFLVATSQEQVHVHVRVRLQELRRQNLHEATTDGGSLVCILVVTKTARRTMTRVRDPDPVTIHPVGEWGGITSFILPHVLV